MCDLENNKSLLENKEQFSEMQPKKERTKTKSPKLEEINFRIEQLHKKQMPEKTVNDFCIVCHPEEKEYYIEYFLRENPGKTLIYSNTPLTTQYLSHLLHLLKYNVYAVQNYLLEKQKTIRLKNFLESPNGVMITTDQTLPEFDKPKKFDNVIQYQSPRSFDNYLNRLLKKTGKSLLLINVKDEQRNLLYEDIPTYIIKPVLMKKIIKCVDVATEVNELQRRLFVKKRDLDKLLDYGNGAPPPPKVTSST